MHILICEDSVEGILTGIYRACEWHLEPEDTRIQIGEAGNLQLFAEYHTVEPNAETAGKVIWSIRAKLGDEVAYDLHNAMASADEEKGDAVYHTVVMAYAGKGRSVMNCLQNDYVRKVSELSRNVWCETHHLYGFLRFEELASGVLYASISPKNHILAMLAPHFADRFPLENFVIHDVKRQLYVVHPRKQDWYMIHATEEQNPDAGQQGKNMQLSEREDFIQSLFRHFVSTISIEDRKNTDLQRNLLPLRFRPFMTEFRTTKNENG